MTDPGEGDRRIEQQERELARMQSEETTYRQIEANLVRERLKTTLGTAGVIAAAVHEMIAGFDAGIQQMADDLSGGNGR